MSGNFDLHFASQLSRINALAATLTGDIDVPEILTSLANNARSILDGDESFVTLERGAEAPLRATSTRERTWLNAELTSTLTHAESSPPVGPAEFELGWLSVPIARDGDRPRGALGVRLGREDNVSSADAELLTLLAHLAARTLEAAELRRVLSSSEARLRSLVESAPVGIIESDAAANVLWWNQSAAKLFDWNLCVPRGCEMPALPAGLAAPLATLWRDVARSSATREDDFADVEIRGRLTALHASATLVPTTDRNERRIWTLIDEIADGPSLDPGLKTSRHMEIRGQVASGVAHDFNNLLTLISGYAEILLQDLGADDRAFQMVQEIKSTASRASVLTGQMQTVGRIKPANPVLLNTVATLRMNAEVLQRIVGVDIDVTWSLDDDHPCIIEVDADQFEQMMLNLTLNARDAMPRGGRLSISVEAITAGNDHPLPIRGGVGDFVLICVADTGDGMSAETRRRCFEPYFTTKGPLQGSGLGLSAARRLVEESGGQILCTSQLGAGSTFHIFFPAAPGATAQEAQPTDIVRPYGSAKVLLAEDDEALRHLMGRALVRNGFRVLEAETGARALELARTFDDKIDLLVSAVSTPAVSGRDLAMSLLAANENLRVLLVAAATDADVLGGLPRGRSSFLAKPFRPSELIHKVHALLEEREAGTDVS